MKNSEDWSSFLSTLGLCLMSLGAYSMKLNLNEDEMDTIEVITTVLPCVCIAAVLFIMIMFDLGLKQKMCGSKAEQQQQQSNNNINSGKTSSLTQVQPIESTGRDNDDDGELESLRRWGNGERTQRRIEGGEGQ